MTALNTNFAKEARLKSNRLKVDGTTESIPAGWELVTRYVSVAQKDKKLRGEVKATGSWSMSKSAVGFTAGTAVVVGLETYYCENRGTEKPPAFIAITWSQSIEIKQEP
jgi:hypothetical protein